MMDEIREKIRKVDLLDLMIHVVMLLGVEEETFLECLEDLKP